MAKSRKLKNLAVLVTGLALGSFLATQESEADVTLVGGLGLQSQLTSGIVDEAYSPGAALQAEAKIGNETATLDLGIGVYDSPIDSYRIQERRLFTSSTESYSESLKELAFKLGATILLRNDSSKAAPYFGGGLMASTFTQDTNFYQTGYKEGSTGHDSDPVDNAFGGYGKFGIVIPFNNSSLFLETEYRKTTGDLTYEGLAGLVKCGFSLK
jgi:hypothetical protein